jgi:adenylate kinase
MMLILLGAPGAGKGTQAEVICQRLHIPAISTGNSLREALRSGSELGQKVKSYMESGSLVPDDIVIDVLKDRIAQPDCENGFILDGFPRTIPQAEALDAMGVNIDRVIDIVVPDEKIVNRMSGRRVCEKCGATYHLVNNPSKVDGVCDKCAGTLIQRKDDNAETVQERLRVYHNQTEPLENYYEAQGKLFKVDGDRGVAEISRDILKELEG